MARRPPPRFVPPPPPGAAGADRGGAPSSHDLLKLPTTKPGRPPARRAPRLGGIGAPPELRRRADAIRAAPGARAIEERVRATLRKAQRKLLAAQRRLQDIAGAGS